MSLMSLSVERWRNEGAWHLLRLAVEPLLLTHREEDTAPLPLGGVMEEVWEVGMTRRSLG